MIISYDVADVTQLYCKLLSCLSCTVRGMQSGISCLSQLAVFDLNSMLQTMIYFLCKLVLRCIAAFLPPTLVQRLSFHASKVLCHWSVGVTSSFVQFTSGSIFWASKTAQDMLVWTHAFAAISRHSQPAELWHIVAPILKVCMKLHISHLYLLHLSLGCNTHWAHCARNQNVLSGIKDLLPTRSPTTCSKCLGRTLWTTYQDLSKK